MLKFMQVIGNGKEVKDGEYVIFNTENNEMIRILGFVHKDAEPDIELEPYDEIPPSHAEILGGIMVDIEKGVDSSEIVKNVILYLLKRNEIDGFNGNKVSFELKDNDVNIIKDNKGE